MPWLHGKHAKLLLSQFVMANLALVALLSWRKNQGQIQKQNKKPRETIQHT
jgi:hypothetical protein